LQILKKYEKKSLQINSKWWNVTQICMLCGNKIID